MPDLVAGDSLVIGQIGMGLHYWPISPLAYGLILLGPAYALTSLAGSIEENRSWRTLWIEPAVMLAVLWVLALISAGDNALTIDHFARLNRRNAYARPKLPA